LNASGVANLIGTTSSIIFTRLATFGKMHHSLPYNILCDFPCKLHPNDISSQYSHVGVPKLGLLLSWNFGHSYIPQIKFIWSMWRHYIITFKCIFHFTFQSEIIWHLLWGNLWLGVKFPIWLLPYFNNHNSCIKGLHEQCKNILDIYTSKTF